MLPILTLQGKKDPPREADKKVKVGEGAYLLVVVACVVIRCQAACADSASMQPVSVSCALACGLCAVLSSACPVLQEDGMKGGEDTMRE